MDSYRLLAVALVASCSGPELVELSDGSVNVGRHAIAFDGRTYAVVWTTVSAIPTPAGDRVWFARVTPGHSLELGPVSVFDSGGDVTELRVEAIEEGYVAWFRRHDAAGTDSLFAVVLDASGTELAAPQNLGPLRIAGVGQTFAVDWTGDRFVVAMQRAGGTDTEIRLGVYGADLGTLVSPIALEASPAVQYEPSIAWSTATSQVIVMWSENNMAHVIRTDSAAVGLAPSATIADFGAPHGEPHVVASADMVAAGWTENPYRRRFRFATSSDALSWQPHTSLIPDNRYESIEWGAALRDGHATLVWKSDATTALPVIHTGRLELAAGTRLEGVQTLTSAAAPHFDPRIATGITESGVTYLGEYAGARRLYFTTVD